MLLQNKFGGEFLLVGRRKTIVVELLIGITIVQISRFNFGVWHLKKCDLGWLESLFQDVEGNMERY